MWIDRNEEVEAFQKGSLFFSFPDDGSSYVAAPEKLCEKFSTSRTNLVIVNS
jgi:hypothetical protein